MGDLPNDFFGFWAVQWPGSAVRPQNGNLNVYGFVVPFDLESKQPIAGFCLGENLSELNAWINFRKDLPIDRGNDLPALNLLISQT